MDRRHNTKKAGRPSEKQLREALDVIIQSYEGVTPGKLYGKAFQCFDALIDISNNSDAIRTFSSRNNIDLKYLVDGANFVISKIHFNPENNYYTTLGLSGKASRAEIRERWKMFMLLYHPDRQEGDQEWVAERAKKVNEAYNTLKDDAKRRTYDRQLYARSSKPKPAGPSKTKQKKSPRAHVGKDSPHPVWIGLRKYLPRALVGIYIVAAFLVIGFIYHQNRSSRLEAELLSGKDVISVSGAGQGLPVLMGDNPPSRQVNEGTKKGIPGGKDPLPLNRVASPDVISKENVAGDSRRETALISDNGTDETTGIYKRQETDVEKWLATDIKKEETKQPEKAGEAVSGDSSEPEEKPSNIAVAPPPASSVIEISDAKVAKKSGINGRTEKKISNSMGNVYNTRDSEEGRPVKQVEAGNTRRFQEKGTVFAPYDKPAAPVIAHSYRETGTITEEEARDFMSRYIKAYERNDFDTFMSLFSRSAVENGRRDYSSIRDRYRETFRFKKDGYRLRNMSIRIEGPNAFVSGIYGISFYYPTEGRWVKYGGRIKWRLIKEDNALKIIKMNYDN